MTQDKINKIKLLRLLVGDTERSPFYPILTDEEFEAILDSVNWNVDKAVYKVATTITFLMSSVNIRERTGDIEVWNNASSEYRKALELLLNKPIKPSDLPDLLTPYAAGISRKDVCGYFNNPDVVRSPLTQISPCVSWMDKIDNYPCSDCSGCLECRP